MFGRLTKLLAMKFLIIIWVWFSKDSLVFDFIWKVTFIQMETSFPFLTFAKAKVFH